MKALMVLFDSLNRRMLSPYGCDWVHTPNFQRLAQRTATFDTSYVGSMPCMPARRELHTGRYNFLHRSWGPVEPFDDSMPELLKQNGIYTHLCSDHYHYWEDGGCTYHTRYNSWEIARGQEYDAWKGVVGDITVPANTAGHVARQNLVNRQAAPHPEQMPQAVTFAQGMEFLNANHQADNWFLTIETFDPHEPYWASEQFRSLYPHVQDDLHFDWPPYARVQENAAAVQHCRFESAALHSMCDYYLGQVLDLMDRLDLWQDTLLIVNTDHGFLMGEHDWWAKCVQPFYNEVAHTPLFIWDPRCRVQAERRSSLVQTIDLAPTLLDYFGVPLPPAMQGVPLGKTVAQDSPVHEAGLFGVFGGHVNVTDGRWVYMRAPATAENQPLCEYTVMPTHMTRPFSVEELQHASLAPPFGFTKGCPTLRIPGRQDWVRAHNFGTMLFDLEHDPQQGEPVQDAAQEARMTDLLVDLMRRNEAPAEQFERLGLASR